MSVFENIARKVTDTAKVAAKKSSELVEVTKLNISIGSEEDKIEKVYKEIGKTVYESYAKGEDISEMFVEKCKEIETYNTNIKGMRDKILELKNQKICPNCREELDVEVLYCPKCGTKQEEIEKKEEVVFEPLPINDKICAECGTVCSEDSLFCVKCGTKLE